LTQHDIAVTQVFTSTFYKSNLLSDCLDQCFPNILFAIIILTSTNTRGWRDKY